MSLSALTTNCTELLARLARQVEERSGEHHLEDRRQEQDEGGRHEESPQQLQAARDHARQPQRADGVVRRHHKASNRGREEVMEDVAAQRCLAHALHRPAEPGGAPGRAAAAPDLLVSPAELEAGHKEDGGLQAREADLQGRPHDGQLTFLQACHGKEELGRGHLRQHPRHEEHNAGDPGPPNVRPDEPIHDAREHDRQDQHDHDGQLLVHLLQRRQGVHRGAAVLLALEQREVEAREARDLDRSKEQAGRHLGELLDHGVGVEVGQVQRNVQELWLPRDRASATIAVETIH
mmetsp:Transcript_90656/g.265336  ORF Transcript_90656/g.265336 Transcript_90656/m.265336 type:complete len:292 (-) Transcript_90656:2095-2970(-)